jgi:hypothetical protein
MEGVLSIHVPIIPPTSCCESVNLSGNTDMANVMFYPVFVLEDNIFSLVVEKKEWTMERQLKRKILPFDVFSKSKHK